MAARRTAAVLLFTCSLAITLLIWKLTVRSAICRMSAISPEVLPSPVQRSTSASRWNSSTASAGMSLGATMRAMHRWTAWTNHIIWQAFVCHSVVVTASPECVRTSRPVMPPASRHICARPARSPNDRASSHSSGVGAKRSSDQRMGDSERIACCTVGSMTKYLSLGIWPAKPRDSCCTWRFSATSRDRRT